jgi:hypothetical protein
MTCSRCNSPWPLPGCFVCGDTLHEPESTMTYPTITTEELQDIADKLREYAKQVEDILDAAMNSDITPRTATDRLNRVLMSAEDFSAMKQTPLD